MDRSLRIDRSQGPPVPRMPLIGRAGEVARVLDLLVRPDVPLVTLSGRSVTAAVSVPQHQVVP